MKKRIQVTTDKDFIFPTPREKLAAVLKVAAEFASDDTTRPFMCTVQLEKQASGHVRVVATDGHRLFLSEVEWEGEFRTVNVPKANVESFAQVILDGKETSVAPFPAIVFPNYRNVLPVDVGEKKQVVASLSAFYVPTATEAIVKVSLANAPKVPKKGDKLPIGRFATKDDLDAARQRRSYAKEIGVEIKQVDKDYPAIIMSVVVPKTFVLIMPRREAKDCNWNFVDHVRSVRTVSNPNVSTP